MKRRYEEINGGGSWDQYMDMMHNDIQDYWTELLFYRADLSSK